MSKPTDVVEKEPKEEPRGKEGMDGEEKDRRAEKDGKAEGSPTPTVTNSRGTSVPAMPGLNGGLLMRGNPGHDGSGTGRPKESIRIKATGACEAEVDRFKSLMVKLNDRCEQELAEGGRLDDAIKAIRESVRIFSGFAAIGPGTKVTNVVEREGYHDAASRAYDSHDGTKLDFLQRLKAELSSE